MENLVKKQEVERQTLMTLKENQKEEECRLAHEAERLKLLEERMKGFSGGALPKESPTS